MLFSGTVPIGQPLNLIQEDVSDLTRFSESVEQKIEHNVLGFLRREYLGIVQREVHDPLGINLILTNKAAGHMTQRRALADTPRAGY